MGEGPSKLGEAAQPIRATTHSTWINGLTRRRSIYHLVSKICLTQPLRTSCYKTYRIQVERQGTLSPKLRYLGKQSHIIFSWQRFVPSWKASTLGAVRSARTVRQSTGIRTRCYSCRRHTEQDSQVQQRQQCSLDVRPNGSSFSRSRPTTCFLCSELVSKTIRRNVTLLTIVSIS